MPENEHRPRAGRAFVQAIEGDAEAQAALERAQARLRVFGAAAALLRPGNVVTVALTGLWDMLAEIKREQDAELAKLAAELRISEAEAAAEWEGRFGEPYPRDVEGWQRLAVRAGMNFDGAMAGQWGPADVLPLIEGYLTRLRDARASGGAAGAPATADGTALAPEDRALALLVAHPDWSGTRIAKAIGVTRRTLYKWGRYRAAREALKSARPDAAPRGSKGADGEVDAWE